MALDSAAPFDVMVLGSAFVELTPAQSGCAITEAADFVALPAGAAANFALSLAALGPRVAFLGRVGDDELGRWLAGCLRAHGINADLLRPVPGQLTPLTVCWADGLGRKTFYFYRFPGFSDPMATFSVADVDPVEILSARLFDFTEASLRSQPLREAALHAARLARDAGRTVCYAVNYRPDSWREGLAEIRALQQQAVAAADLVLMNRDEAQFLFATTDPRAASLRAAELGPTAVVVTGGDAPVLVACGGEVIEVPIYAVPVQYDVGAGDTFHAGFIAGYLRGLPPPEAARWGAAAAALKISHPASAPPPTAAEVAEFVASG